MTDASSATPHPRRGSVFDSLPAYVWSDQESVAYEVALEAIGEVVGVCSAKIEVERKKPEPDEAVLIAWREERRRWTAARRALHATDHDEVARVRREAPARADYLDTRRTP